MEDLSNALKHVSLAVDLDSRGLQQAAFSKYIQSLQVLVCCVNSLFITSGFQKMLEKKREVMQVLSMIHECSDRISVILNNHGKMVNSPSLPKHKENLPVLYSSISKLSDFEKVQRENKQLFKQYKARLERAKDKNTKTNLTLEFQRRLAENAVLARNKYELVIKHFQKERVQLMENAIRQLFEKEELLNEKEKEKRFLYDKVLQYVKIETWPTSWKLNSYEMTVLEIVEKVFYTIIRSCEHPLTQWLILVQTNIKRKVNAVLEEYNEYLTFFPERNPEHKLNYSVNENDEQIVFKREKTFAVLPYTKMLALQNTLEEFSSDIKNAIEDALEIFYLIYKSLLPENSEAICYQIIEEYFFKPFWSNLFILFRILNLSSEYKICESMLLHRHCTLMEFGIASCIENTDEFYSDVITLLKTMPVYNSLVNKLRILVQVSQKICECSTFEDNIQRKLGTDEMIPVLCYVIVKSEISQLIAECFMLEHLFDMRYMLGEEGYALSSFLSALKCIEIKKLTDCKRTKEEI